MKNLALNDDVIESNSISKDVNATELRRYALNIQNNQMTRCNVNDQPTKTGKLSLTCPNEEDQTFEKEIQSHSIRATFI